MVMCTAEGVYIRTKVEEHMTCVQAMSHALHVVQGCHSAYIESGGRDAIDLGCTASGRQENPPRMASVRKTDRLDCVSSDTSSSVGATVVGAVVVLAVGSETVGGLGTSVGFGHAPEEPVLQVLVILRLCDPETSIPVVVVD